MQLVEIRPLAEPAVDMEALEVFVLSSLKLMHRGTLK